MGLCYKLNGKFMGPSNKVHKQSLHMAILAHICMYIKLHVIVAKNNSNNEHSQLNLLII